MLSREEQEVQNNLGFSFENISLAELQEVSKKPLELLWLSQSNAKTAALFLLSIINEQHQENLPRVVVTSKELESKNNINLESLELEKLGLANSIKEKYLEARENYFVPKKILLDHVDVIEHNIVSIFDYPTPDIFFLTNQFNKKSHEESLYEIAVYLTAAGKDQSLFYFLEQEPTFLEKQQLLNKHSQNHFYYVASGLHENYVERDDLDLLHLRAFLRVGQLTSKIVNSKNKELDALNSSVEEHNKVLEESNDFLTKTSQEITESFAALQKANSLLKQNEDFINAVFQVANVGLSIIDKEGKMVKMNREFCHIYLFNENELLNLPISHLLPKSKTIDYVLNPEDDDSKSFSEVSVGIRKDGKKLTLLNSTNRVVLQDEIFYINTVRDITKSTKDLHLLHDTLNSLKIGGWEYEVHQRKFIVTEELYLILDLENDYYLDENSILNFIKEEDLSMLRKACENISDRKSAIIREINAKTKQGDHKVLKVTARPIFKNNLLVKYTGTVQDITQEKLKEKKTRENEHLYKTLIANFPGGTIDIIDKNYRYIFTGGKELEDLPQNPEDVLGKSIYEIYDGELSEKLGGYLKRSLSGEQLTFDIDYQGKYWNVFSIPLYNDDKKVDKVMLLTQNISLQRKADKGLKETHKSLSDFRKALDVAAYVAIMNEDADISYLNDNLISLSGYPKESLISQSFDVLLDKEKLVPSFSDDLKDILFNGKIWQGEIICKTKDNTNFWLNMSIIPFLDEKGKPYQFLAVGSNDTVRKKAEEQIKIQNKELTRINAELDQFVYSTSHDIRSPLVSILGLINIARLELNESDPVQSYLGMIEKSVKKLDKFVQEIIHYSQNARMEVQYEQIEFEQEIREVFESLKQYDGHANLEFRVDCEVEVPFYSDINRLKAIFNNLLTNSILYQRSSVDQSFVEVKVRADKDHAVIEVIDNGIGISEEYIDKIFDMFFKAATFSSGSGLGLYVVKESLNILDGDIKVISKQNEGATFVIEIPNGTREIDIIS